MKKYILVVVSLAMTLFVSCAPLAPKPLTGSKLKEIRDAFAFDDNNPSQGSVAGDVTLSLDAVSLPGISDLVVYYGTDAENDKQLVGSTPVKEFTEGAIATLDSTEFSGDEKLYLFLKNSALTTGENEVFSGVDLTVIDFVDDEVIEESIEESTEKSDELNHILFDFDQYSLTLDGVAILDDFVASVEDLSNTTIYISGHADERGSNEYNLALGERRAVAVSDYLVLQGALEENITILTYGEEVPLCEEATKECWQENRRVETILYF